MFWQLLHFSLLHNMTVIDSAMCLHNYMGCDLHNGRRRWKRETFMSLHPGDIFGVFDDETNEDSGNRGRPSVTLKILKENGEMRYVEG